MAITHFNFHLLIFKLNPCRFSIFYCGCKQPKSVHILKLRAKVRFFVETSAVFLPKLLWHPLSTPFFPIFCQPQTTDSFFIPPATVRFGLAEAIPHSPFFIPQPPCASVLPKQSLIPLSSFPSHRVLRFCRSHPLILQPLSFGSTKLFLRFN